MPRHYANPYLLLTLTSLFWSGNMVIARGIHESVPPFTLAFWRWSIALALVLPFALPHLRSQWSQIRQHWRVLLILGILSVGCYNTFVYIALQHTTATSATMLNSFVPVATIAFAYLLLGKRLTPLEAAGALLSLLGVLTIVARGDIDTLLGLQLNRGDVWMMLAVLTWGLYTVGLRWRPQGIHPMLLLAALTVIGVAMLIPLYLWEILNGQTIQSSTATWVGILYIGVFPGFVGYVFYNAGIAAVGPSRGALFIHLMPVFGTLLAIVFLGEQPLWFHYAGIVMVFSGIFLTTLKA
jgi:drug/metabolite transporter (DMT)-like permease